MAGTEARAPFAQQMWPGPKRGRRFVEQVRRQGQKSEDAPRQRQKISPPHVPKRVPDVHRIILFTRQNAPRRSEEKCGRDLGESAICPTNVAAAKARAPICPPIGGDVHRTILFTRQSVPRRSERKCGRRRGDSGVRAKKVRTLHAKSPVWNSSPDSPDSADSPEMGPEVRFEPYFLARRGSG